MGSSNVYDCLSCCILRVGRGAERVSLARTSLASVSASTHPANLALLVSLVKNEPFAYFQVTCYCCYGERGDAARVWVANVVAYELTGEALQMVNGRFG